MREIERFLSYKKSPHQFTQIAFYGGNFLGLDNEQLCMLLETASSFVRSGKAESIRFSTRPDTINNKILTFLKKYPVSTVELGVQSMDDDVLALSNRGHTRLDTINAVQSLQQFGYEIGLQMMVGLPGDDEVKNLKTGYEIAELSPDFVRIYPTVVLANSPLAVWYKNGKYVPLSVEESIKMVKKLYLLFTERGISVIRMGLQADRYLDTGSAILGGAYHPAYGHMVVSELFFDMTRLAVENTLALKKNKLDKEIDIYIHPRNMSNLRGQKNKNIKSLKQMYGVESVNIVSDTALDMFSIKIGRTLLSLKSHSSEILHLIS